MPVQWPSPSYGGGILPDGVGQGATIAPLKPTVTRVSPDVGPAQSRLITTKTLFSVGFEMPMTELQIIVLWSFYDLTLTSGTIPFQWVLPQDPLFGLILYDFVSRPLGVWEQADVYGVSVSLETR